MHEVGVFEAKNKLGTLLDWVENGEEVVITRHGKAVARLIPNTTAHDPELRLSEAVYSIGANGRVIAMKAVREPGTG